MNSIQNNGIVSEISLFSSRNNGIFQIKELSCFPFSSVEVGRTTNAYERSRANKFQTTVLAVRPSLYSGVY